MNQNTLISYLFILKKLRFITSLVLLWLVIYSLPVKGQQLTELTQYMFTMMSYNPGYAGNNGGICVNGLIREQWMGFKDMEGNRVSPETMFVTIDAPVRFLHGGLSASVMQDKIGFFRTIGVKVGYAYRADIGSGTLGAGTQINLQNDKIDFSKFSGHIIEENDPVLEAENDQSDLTVDFDLGVYYEVPESFYIGFSASQIAQSKAKNTFYNQRRTYYLTGGYNFVFPKYPLFELKPSALVKFDGAVFQLNIAAILAYNKKFWGGLEYRYQDAVAILAGVNIKSFRVGVSYDINTSALTSYNSGTIEVMLGYCFKIDLDKSRKRYKNTRFL